MDATRCGILSRAWLTAAHLKRRWNVKLRLVAAPAADLLWSFWIWTILKASTIGLGTPEVTKFFAGWETPSITCSAPMILPVDMVVTSLRCCFPARPNRMEESAFALPTRSRAFPAKWGSAYRSVLALPDGRGMAPMRLGF